MKIAFNPSTVAALTTPPNNKDITFDLRGHSIFARGVEFKGTDTNTWRDIKINNVSIGSNTLDLRNGSNTTLTNTNGVVTINSTWRPVVDNLTSDSTTSSLSAKQGKVLKALIDGKSNSDHNHDGRYLKLTGGTMLGALNFANNTWNLVGDDSYIGDCNISGHFGIKAANTTYPGITFFNNASTFLGNLTAYSGNIKYGAYSLQFLDNGNTSVSASTWTNPFSNYNSNAVADGQAICVWGQSSYLSNLSTDTGDMSLWLKRINANVAMLNMVLDGEYYANGNQRLAHVSEIPNKDSWNYDDRYLRLTGGWMSGDINFGGDNKIYWGRNTDSASISFKNDGDGDANSYMSFVTSDNGNEYFRWSHSSGSTNTEWMALRSDGLRVRGTKVSLEGHSHNDLYYTKAESNAKYITDIATSVNKLTFTRNGSNIARNITVNVVYSQGQLPNIPNKDATTKANPGLLIYDSYNQTIGTNPYSSVLSINTGGTIQIAGNWGDDLTRNLYWRSQSDRNVANYPWKSWRTILDSENYSSTLDSRYYTESEVNSLLDAKLNRQNLSYGTWNPRGYHLAADYHYNGGDLSISENNGKMYVSVDGCFWQNEGQYRVLDTSDIGDIRDSVTLHQYLSATDAAWYPLVWGGASHNNTSDSTGPIYKSYDKLSWQTSSQTLYATNIQTNNIKNLSIGGGIYWNSYVESASDGSDAASITLVRSGVAGGTTLVLSQMNDTNDTIQFKTNTAARLYHNSYPILTTQNTYVSNNKGYIYGNEITQVNNSDTLDNWHKDEINRTLYITSNTAGLSSYWAKLWEINLNNQYNDVTITFLAAASYYPSYFSIFSVYLRQNGSGTSKNISARLVELIGNIAVGDTDLRLYVNNTTGNCQLWGNVRGQYGTMNLSVLKKAWRTETDSPNIGTFFYTNFNSVQPLPGDGWSKIGVTQQLSTGVFNPTTHTHTVFKNNLMIKGTNGVSDSASIHLGIGDSDTGFKWISDGVCQIYANNAAVGQWTSKGMDWFKNPTVNGNKVWNAGNDGSGSGLDADTLDGYHETKFFRHRGNTNKNESPLKYTGGTLEYYGNLPSGMNNVYTWGGSLVSGGEITSLQFYYPDPANDKSIYARTFWSNNDSGWHKLAFTDSKVADSDKLDGVHLNGIFTGFSYAQSRLTATIGTVSKTVNVTGSYPSIGGVTMNTIASYGNCMGMANLASSNSNVNPNNQTSWHHFINMSYNTESTNMWQTQFAIKAGTTEVWVRSRAGGSISDNSAWAAPWVRLARITDNIASATNADMVDGEHASSFVRAGHYESNDLNKLDTYSFIRSVNSNVSSTSPKGNTGWYNVIQLVHRNGAADGPSYIGQIALGMTTNTNDMFFRGRRTDPWKTVIHSGNYTEFINNYYWANVKISTSSSTTTSPTFSNVYLGNSLYLNTRGSNSIYNGPNDSANGVGGPLNNLVFSSWYGVSFTTSCAGLTYTNKNAVSINCRTGQLYAREVQANGFMHTGHNNNDAVLLAGGGYKTLKDFIFLNKSYNYTDNKHYNLSFHKLSGICNNLVWVDGHVKGSIAKFFVIDPAVFPYRYDEDPNLNTIYLMTGNNYITINAIGIVTINNATDHEQRVGFFYTGRA